MPTTLLVTIALSVVALLGISVILRKISASRQAARIKVLVEPPQKKSNRSNR